MRVADPIRPQPATAAVLLLFLLLAWPAAAQFQLQVVEPAGPRSAPPVYDLGSGYANETLSATFRLGNVSTAPATASVITVGGTGFSLTAPSLPVTIDPGVSLEFQVNFRASGTGSYSAVLRAENITILLTAAVLPRLTYLVEGATAGVIIDFGSALPGTAMRRHFTVLNETSLILTVPAISLIGKDFFFACNPPSGITLAPLQSAAFDIDFIPSGAGARQAILVLGDRSSVVTGTGLEPPLPQPQISIDLPRTASAQQGILIVKFDRPASSAGTGTAVLDFRGSADPTVAFAGGGRTAAFVIAPGDTRATLPFQTGTTAGTLIFSVVLGSASDSLAVPIPALPPALTQVEAARTGTGMEVDVSGWDNTHSVSRLEFTFYDAAGNPVAPGALRVDASAEFAHFYAVSDVGGSFALRAAFPVVGDATQLAAVEVSFGNLTGTTKTARIPIR